MVHKFGRTYRNGIVRRTDTASIELGAAISKSFGREETINMVGPKPDRWIRSKRVSDDETAWHFLASRGPFEDP